jgi:hypothetical protein
MTLSEVPLCRHRWFFNVLVCRVFLDQSRISLGITFQSNAMGAYLPPLSRWDWVEQWLAIGKANRWLPRVDSVLHLIPIASAPTVITSSALHFSARPHPSRATSSARPRPSRVASSAPLPRPVGEEGGKGKEARGRRDLPAPRSTSQELSATTRGAQIVGVKVGIEVDMWHLLLPRRHHARPTPPGPLPPPPASTFFSWAATAPCLLPRPFLSPVADAFKERGSLPRLLPFLLEASQSMHNGEGEAKLHLPPLLDSALMLALRSKR